jgi:opacity protein-like surface antigen
MRVKGILHICVRRFLVGLLFIVPLGLQAQEVARYELGGAYSYVHASSGNGGGTFNVNGGRLSGDYNLNPLVAIVADVGAYKFSDMPPGIGAKLYTFLVGPRFSCRRYARLTPFSEVLVGLARHTASTAQNIAGENSFGMTFGGGADVRLNQRLSLRPMQVDYLFTRFADAAGNRSDQNNLRVSAGIVFRIGTL